MIHLLTTYDTILRIIDDDHLLTTVWCTNYVPYDNSWWSIIDYDTMIMIIAYDHLLIMIL